MARRLLSSRRATGEPYPPAACSVKIFFSSDSLFKSGPFWSGSFSGVLSLVEFTLGLRRLGNWPCGACLEWDQLLGAVLMGLFVWMRSQRLLRSGQFLRPNVTVEGTASPPRVSRTLEPLVRQIVQSAIHSNQFPSTCLHTITLGSPPNPFVGICPSREYAIPSEYCGPAGVQKLTYSFPL